MRAYTHGGWAHRQRTQKNCQTNFLWCFWRRRGSNLRSLDVESDALTTKPPSLSVARIGPSDLRLPLSERVTPQLSGPLLTFSISNKIPSLHVAWRVVLCCNSQRQQARATSPRLICSSPTSRRSQCGTESDMMSWLVGCWEFFSVCTSKFCAQTSEYFHRESPFIVLEIRVFFSPVWTILVFHTRHLREWSLKTALYASDIQISYTHLCCFTYVRSYVSVLKANFAKNLHLALSSLD